MMLQSGELAMIKRPKLSSNNITNEIINEDLFSKLPDALLTQIQSRLPDADAARTRILSNRWNNLFPFLPNLHFSTNLFWPIQQVNKFFNSVNQTLTLRGDLPIQKLYLHFTDNCEYNRIYDLFRDIVQRRIEELDVNFMIIDLDGRISSRWNLFRVRSCWDWIKTCNSLVSLSLRWGFVLDIPEALDFPCLKKLNLHCVVHLNGKSFSNLVSSCPVLEELVFRRIRRDCDAQLFNIVSPCLKTLIYISTMSHSDDEVMIDAPKLEFLQILDDKSSYYSLKNSPSLVEARIAISSNALGTILVYNRPEYNIHRYNNMHLFPNLVKLVIRIYSNGDWNNFLALLNHMPNLEHITFADGFLLFPLTDPYYMSQNPRHEAPACLRLNVKEVVIRNRKAIQEEEFVVISYLLKHANNLEVMTINSYQGDDNLRLKLMNMQLENFARGSHLFRIEFVTCFSLR
ncbi:F-box/FBD/LRR-repeat protein At3g26920-like isoform X2 [Rutidosis leptorrhynchoides]|uniref:F-box/FBD/LRR-repeat protein At3g26920-like isoform X2 n=1 Tax=Rutidosis leptorrhynchoides TaxID=125765 RepID=UPI003A996F5E